MGTELAEYKTYLLTQPKRRFERWSVTASAPAKVILFGEHFVVYRVPAIVSAINLRAKAYTRFRNDKKVYVVSYDLKNAGYFKILPNGKLSSITVVRGGSRTIEELEPFRIVVEKVFELSGVTHGLDLKIKSAIPISAGLGSSAAVVTASSAAVGELLGLNLDNEEIFKIALEAEKFVHVNPSGVDPAISTYGGLVYFRRGDEKNVVKKLNSSSNLPLVIGDTGVRRPTGAMVSAVRRLKEKYTHIIEQIIELGEYIAVNALRALKVGDLRTLGGLMNINHGLLSAVGVSNEALDRLVHSAREAGAYGAKLTGAGGGGCMIALTPKSRMEDVARAIMEAGGTPFTADISYEGVKIEGED